MLLKKKERGFTIIEVMIVMVIIGVIAAMSIGSFDRFIKRQKLKIEARDLISDLRLTRSYAVSHKDQYGIYFDLNNQQYVLFKDLVNPSSYTYDYGDSVLKTNSISDMLYFWWTFPNDAVVYLPSGSASSSGQVYIFNMEIYEYFMADVLGSTGRARLTAGHEG